MVLGPAGIGKSRLARELHGALRDRATVLAGRCLPYGEGITYWALGEIVRQLAGGRDLRAALVAAVRRRARAPNCSPTACCRPPAWRRHDRARGPHAGRHGAVRDARAPSGRVVLVFEDLHWAEPPLLDLVEHLLEHTATRR